MRLKPLTTLIFVVVVFLPQEVVGQSGVAFPLIGIVTDGFGRPIPYANVVRDGSILAITDTLGQFRLGKQSDRLVLEIRRIGFQPERVELAGIRDTLVRIRLAPIAQRLDAVSVSASSEDESSTALKLHGFYDRLTQSRHGTLTGHFVTPEEIELRHPVRASQMVEALPGIEIREFHFRYDGQPYFVPLGANGCLATVYVNGHRLNNTIAWSREDEIKSASFDGLVEPRALAGIEVYTRGTRAPVEFQALNGSCGVVLVWTK